MYSRVPWPLWLCGLVRGGEGLVLCEWQAGARACASPFVQVAGTWATANEAWVHVLTHWIEHGDACVPACPPLPQPCSERSLLYRNLGRSIVNGKLIYKLILLPFPFTVFNLLLLIYLVYYFLFLFCTQHNISLTLIWNIVQKFNTMCIAEEDAVEHFVGIMKFLHESPVD